MGLESELEKLFGAPQGLPKSYYFLSYDMVETLSLRPGFPDDPNNEIITFSKAWPQNHLRPRDKCPLESLP